MLVYRLYHIREKTNAEDDEKLIGIYTTEENAIEAMRRARKLPGFKDYPDSFQIFDHVLDKDDWIEGFISADEAEKDE